MDKKYARQLRRINYLASEMDSLYHLADLRLGISDSVSLVLYAPSTTARGPLPLGDIYKCPASASRP